MQYPSEIITHAENRLIAFFKHLQEIRDSSYTLEYNPDLFPWDSATVKSLLTLNHQDFIKAQIFIVFKLNQYSRWIESLSENTGENIYCRGLISHITNFGVTSKKDGILPTVAEGGVNGIGDLEQLHDPAFYNWYSLNYDKESVQTELRLTWSEAVANHGLDGKPPMLPLYAIPKVINDEGLNFHMTSSGNMINIKPDRFYIVTESTEDCLISNIEPYDIRKHHNLVRGTRMNGWMFKIRSIDEGSIISFICNGLELSNYRYDIKLLGLELV